MSQASSCSSAPTRQSQISFLVLGGDCICLTRIAQGLAEAAPTWLSANHTVRGALRIWRKKYVYEDSSRFRRRSIVIPSLATGPRSFICRHYPIYCFKRLVAEVEQWSGSQPYVVIPYPHMVHWIDFLPAERLIYYSFDDYSQYDEGSATFIRECENKLLTRCNHVFASSVHQVRDLQRRSLRPVFHLPHGADPDSLFPREYTEPEPKTVGYVGNLTHRIDWQLVLQVMTRCPDTRFIFVGSLEQLPIAGGNTDHWVQLRQEALGLPNAVCPGKVKQKEVHDWYARFEQSWIPYDINLLFNQASSPTKIFDGIAGGRPVLATSLPECRLYPEHVRVAGDADDMVQAIRTNQDQSDEERMAFFTSARDFIQRNTWADRARQIVNSLNHVPGNGTTVAEPLSVQ